MNKLLAANFLRLKKSKCFWLTMVFMAGAGVFFPVIRYVVMQQEGGYINTLETAFFPSVIFIGFLTALLCGLFIGTEYSDGAIRNKIIVGRKRSDIYLANLITCGAGSVAMYLAFFIPCLAIGIPLLDFFVTPVKIVALYVLAAWLAGLAFTAIYTMVTMLGQNKAVTAVTCVLLAVLLLISGIYMNKRLTAPETMPAYTMGENGVEVAAEQKNPQYLKGTERKVYEFLYDFLPGGQVVQCTALESAHPGRLSLYSAVIVMVTTCAGVLLFRKKDIK